jgi:hypothetical protein
MLIVKTVDKEIIFVVFALRCGSVVLGLGSAQLGSDLLASHKDHIRLRFRCGETRGQLDVVQPYSDFNKQSLSTNTLDHTPNKRCVTCCRLPSSANRP